MEIVYVYQRKRREFGKQTSFRDKPAELSVNVLPDPSYMRNYVERNPCQAEIQAVPEKSEHEVNLQD